MHSLSLMLVGQANQRENRPRKLLKIRFRLPKSKFENYKKRAYPTEILDRIVLIVVSATMLVIY
jgi:hypothetical protein